MAEQDKFRPPVEERWTGGMRTEPVRFEVRTEWLYSEADPRVVVPEGRKRHAFSRGGHVTRSDVPSSYEHRQNIDAHVQRAIEAFGDDKDLVVEVRLKDAPSQEPKTVMQPGHYLELDTSFGEPTLRLVCAAGPGAPCRRRPSDSDRETWSLDDPDLVDADCWAVEWVEAAGFSDAVRCSPDARFDRIPVAVSYDEGVVVAPAGQPGPLATAAAVPEPVLEEEARRG